MLAFSRILNDREVVVVANANTQAGWKGEVIVDFALNPAGSKYSSVFTNKTSSPGTTSAPVLEKLAGAVEIREVSGAITRGPALRPSRDPGDPSRSKSPQSPAGSGTIHAVFYPLSS